MEFALQTLMNGAMLSVFYALLAVGLALILGVMRVCNFAHGELYMVGAYTVWLLYGVGDWPFAVAVLATMGIVAALGLAIERLVFRPARGNLIATFISSIGLIFILQVGAGQMWGVGLAKPVSPVLQGSLEILGATISWQRFILIPVTIFLLGFLWFFLHRFKLGRGLRAVAQDPDAATLQGIGINRMSALAMGIAAALAGAAGALMAPIHMVTPYMGHAIILICMTVVIVGGIGSLGGAILAAIIFGFVHTVVTTYLDSTLAQIIGVVLMLVILATRPKGLLGREEALVELVIER